MLELLWFRVQVILTLALAEQGRGNCPLAAAMRRSLSSSSEISNVDAQCFKQDSISCTADKHTARAVINTFDKLGLVQQEVARAPYLVRRVWQAHTTMCPAWCAGTARLHFYSPHCTPLMQPITLAYLWPHCAFF